MTTESEFGLEQVIRSAQLRAEAVERWHKSRLTEIWRRYVDRVACVNIPIVDINRRLRCQATLTGVSDHVVPAVTQGGEFSVLVWIGDVAKGFRPFNSVVWLECLDHRDVVSGKAFQTLAAPCVEPALGVAGIDLEVLDQELRSVLDFSRVVARQLEDNIIQRRSHIVNDITDDNGEHGWKIWGGPQYDGGLRTSLIISDNVVYAGFPEFLNQRTCLGKMFVGPQEPQPNAVYLRRLGDLATDQGKCKPLDIP